MEIQDFDSSFDKLRYLLQNVFLQEAVVALDHQELQFARLTRIIELCELKKISIKSSSVGFNPKEYGKTLINEIWG